MHFSKFQDGNKCLRPLCPDFFDGLSELFGVHMGHLASLHERIAIVPLFPVFLWDSFILFTIERRVLFDCQTTAYPPKGCSDMVGDMQVEAQHGLARHRCDIGATWVGVVRHGCDMSGVGTK